MEQLTHQEENVMRYVWKLKECVVKDIVDEMHEPRPPYTTVASVVRKLEEKGYLDARKYGNVYVYTPRIEEDNYMKSFMSGVVKNYFANSYKELVSFFVKEQNLSEKELQEIIDLIEKNEK